MAKGKINSVLLTRNKSMKGENLAKVQTKSVLLTGLADFWYNTHQ